MVLSSNRKDRYDSIKKFLCVDCPVPSQCVVFRTLSRPQALMTVATKIALQMACKMGGELWSVEIPVGLSGLMLEGEDHLWDMGLILTPPVSTAEASDDCGHRLLP